MAYYNQPVPVYVREYGEAKLIGYASNTEQERSIEAEYWNAVKTGQLQAWEQKGFQGGTYKESDQYKAIEEYSKPLTKTVTQEQLTPVASTVNAPKTSTMSVTKYNAYTGQQIIPSPVKMISPVKNMPETYQEGYYTGAKPKLNLIQAFGGMFSNIGYNIKAGFSGTDKGILSKNILQPFEYVNTGYVSSPTQFRTQKTVEKEFFLDVKKGEVAQQKYVSASENVSAVLNTKYQGLINAGKLDLPTATKAWGTEYEQRMLLPTAEYTTQKPITSTPFIPSVKEELISQGRWVSNSALLLASGASSVPIRMGAKAIISIAGYYQGWTGVSEKDYLKAGLGFGIGLLGTSSMVSDVNMQISQARIASVQAKSFNPKNLQSVSIVSGNKEVLITKGFKSVGGTTLDFEFRQPVIRGEKGFFLGSGQGEVTMKGIPSGLIKESAVVKTFKIGSTGVVKDVEGGLQIIDFGKGRYMNFPFESETKGAMLFQHEYTANLRYDPSNMAKTIKVSADVGGASYWKGFSGVSREVSTDVFATASGKGFRDIGVTKVFRIGGDVSGGGFDVGGGQVIKFKGITTTGMKPFEQAISSVYAPAVSSALKSMASSSAVTGFSSVGLNLRGQKSISYSAQQVKVTQKPILKSMQMSEVITTQKPVTSTALISGVRLSPALKSMQITGQVPAQIVGLKSVQGLKSAFISPKLMTPSFAMPTITPTIGGGGGGGIIPPFTFGDLGGMGFGKVKGRRQPVKYTPSLKALLFNIKGAKPRGAETGLRLRPITKGFNLGKFTGMFQQRKIKLKIKRRI